MITKLGQTKLQEKIISLKEELRETYQKRAEAAAEGDLKENSAYIYAGEHANLLNSQIEEAVIELKQSTLITPPIQNETITYGHQVKILYLTDNRQLTITLVGKNDARLKPDWISALSPIGIALLGKKVGDTTQVNEQSVRIIEINTGDI